MTADRLQERWESLRAARAQIEAIRLARDLPPQVAAWRGRHLPGGKPLARADAARWLRTAEEEGWLEAGLTGPRGGKLTSRVAVEHRLLEIKDEQPEGVFPIRIIYTDIAWQTTAMPVSTWPPPGALTELRDIATRLRDQLGWTVPSCAGWVVANGFPEVEGMSVEVLPKDATPDQQWRTLVLRVPIEIAPGVLASVYRQKRDELLKEIGSPVGRSIGSRALQSTLFAVRLNHPAVPGDPETAPTWSDVLAAWERQVKSWSIEDRAFAKELASWHFPSARAFAQQVRTTYRRLTGEDLEWVRPSGSRTR